MNEHGLTHFDLTKKDFHLKLKKGADLDDLRGLLASVPAPVAAPVAAVPAAAQASAPVAPVPAGIEITSPMVGTFYSRSSPEAPAYVNVGDSVSVGQTLCIIEAMKVMNEIKAETSGVVKKILVENATAVQFGQPMFLIEKG